jgi:hypothetical protein
MFLVHSKYSYMLYVLYRSEDSAFRQMFKIQWMICRKVKEMNRYRAMIR